MDIVHALLSLRPGARWQISGTDYANLDWLDEKQMPPSRAEVDAEIARLQAEYDSKEYQRLREPEYPPMTDYVDAVYWQTRGDESKMTAYLAAVEAVKSKYPKG